MFFKIGVFKNFATFTKKNTCAGTCSFIKKRLQHRSFPMNIAKFLKTTFSQNTSGQLLLKKGRLENSKLSNSQDSSSGKIYYCRSCRADDKACNYCFVCSDTGHLARNCPLSGSWV